MCKYNAAHMSARKCTNVHLLLIILSSKDPIMRLIRGMRHTSTALYFYGASKKTTHKPRVTFGNMLIQISNGLYYYLQLFY
jgi:hypothetical protein